MGLRQADRGDHAAVATRLATIVTQADRVAEMLEAFVEASRIGTGRLALQREPGDLTRIVRVAAEKARQRAGAAAARPLELDLPEACPGVWDLQRMTSAVRALVHNAYLYGDPAAPVRVKGGRDSHTGRIAVCGGGSGPSPDEERRLFEPFFQGTVAQESSETGSGLGLYNARGVVRAHGGDICLVQGGEPDTFELIVPCGEVSA
jgi:signal transduction histidine kinase